MENQQRSWDLAHVAAITSVVLLHCAAAPYSTTMDANYIVTWFTWDVFQSVAWIGVPLFIMISGALLLHPSKADEPLKVFFKKRWKKIGLPLLLWGAAYFVWKILVDNTPLSVDSILQGVLNGPYLQFWYLYMLIGLYIATPVLRVLVANMKRNVFTYLMIVWLASVILTPLLHLYGQSNVDYFFVFSGYIGCYLFGGYLRDVKAKSAFLYSLLVVGICWTVFGNYFVTGFLGEKFNFLILGNLTPNVVITATAFFLILTRVTYTNPLFSFVGKNTLTIYLGHIMVLQAFEKGFFGFIINSTTVNLAVGIPLITAATLFTTTLAIVPLKRIRLLKRS